MGSSYGVSPSTLENGLMSEKLEASSIHSTPPPTPTTTKSSLSSQRWLIAPTQQFASVWSKLTQRFRPKPLEERRQPVVRPVHGGPRGYPELATFLDSDDNFMVYRRFGYVQARLLLEKQERLRLLEQKLDNLDKRQTAEEEDADALCTVDVDPAFKVDRDNLMAKVERAFHDYADLLLKAQSMIAMGRPTSSEYRSVENYIDNQKPLVEDEAKSYYCKEDLISLRPGREHAWLDATIETTLRRINCDFIEWLFCSKETKQKSNQRNEIYYTRSRIERTVVTIITFMILFLLILPIYLLFKLTEGNRTPHNNAVCIGVLLVFTLAFSAVISLFTRAQRHEILAASAAYCAVLVVFFGNVGSNSSNILAGSGS